MDRQATLQWLNEVSEQAITEARDGRTGLANKLGQIGAFQYYLNNVHTRQVISPDQYANQFPNYMAEVDKVRREYVALESAQETHDKVTEIETGLADFKKAMRKEIRQALKEGIAEIKSEVLESLAADDTVTEDDTIEDDSQDDETDADADTDETEEDSETEDTEEDDEEA